MNPTIRIIFILLICNFANAQYVGGKDDGSAVSPLNGSRLSGEIASFSVLYQGSSGDGFNSKTNQVLLASSNFNIYDGSAGDGFSQLVAATTLSGNNINSLYGGNTGDGFSQNQFQSTIKGQDLRVLFTGNSGDGADSALLNATYLQGFLNELLFNGGNGDGYANLLSSNNYLSGLMLTLFNGGNGDGFASNNFTTALTLDLVEHLIKLDVLLYPNPASHIVTIQSNEGTIITSISLYDISGKQVHGELSKNNNTLNVSHLSDGMYLLNIVSENGAVTKKLIVKK